VKPVLVGIDKGGSPALVSPNRMNHVETADPAEIEA